MSKERIWLSQTVNLEYGNLGKKYIDCHVCDTYQAEIYVGFNPGYEVTEDTLGDKLSMVKLKSICQKFCDKNSLAVSVENTSFIYRSGNESGAKIRFINYPRYPAFKSNILTKALSLAHILKDEFSQYRVSVITTDKTYMLGEIE